MRQQMSSQGFNAKSKFLSAESNETLGGRSPGRAKRINLSQPGETSESSFVLQRWFQPNSMNPVRGLKEKFRELYGAAPRVFRAPGRVNLIGEHTDYNDGFVMPAAIGFYTWVAVAPRRDRRLLMHSENFGESREFDLDDPLPAALGHWSDYVRGVAVTMEKTGHRLRGANLLIQGEVPMGAGLGSSAAIEVATGQALLENSNIGDDRGSLPQQCQQAENEFVGTRCGIMDQFVSCHGHVGYALMLDCRSLSYRLLPLGGSVRLVICNTLVKHDLASSEYNLRRAECEEALKSLRRSLRGIRALRDVSLEELESCESELAATIYRRAKHVVSENRRVQDAARALELGDLTGFGQLMQESHRSLREDFKVSCQELDRMVDVALGVEGVYGARMTGGGFGGCTVNLVQSNHVEEFRNQVTLGYKQATGVVPEIYTCEAAQGVGEAFES
jgi:galactokinase